MQPFDIVDYKKVPFYVYNMHVSLIDDQMVYHFKNKIHPLVTSPKEESVLTLPQFLDRDDDDDAVLLLLFHRKVNVHILRGFYSCSEQHLLRFSARSRPPYYHSVYVSCLEGLIHIYIHSIFFISKVQFRVVSFEAYSYFQDFDHFKTITLRKEHSEQI